MSALMASLVALSRRLHVSIDIRTKHLPAVHHNVCAPWNIYSKHASRGSTVRNADYLATTFQYTVEERMVTQLNNWSVSSNNRWQKLSTKKTNSRTKRVENNTKKCTIFPDVFSLLFVEVHFFIQSLPRNKTTKYVNFLTSANQDTNGSQCALYNTCTQKTKTRWNSQRRQKDYCVRCMYVYRVHVRLFGWASLLECLTTHDLKERFCSHH